MELNNFARMWEMTISDAIEFGHGDGVICFDFDCAWRNAVEECTRRDGVEICDEFNGMWKLACRIDNGRNRRITGRNAYSKLPEWIQNMEIDETFEITNTKLRTQKDIIPGNFSECWKRMVRLAAREHIHHVSRLYVSKRVHNATQNAGAKSLSNSSRNEKGRRTAETAAHDLALLVKLVHKMQQFDKLSHMNVVSMTRSMISRLASTHIHSASIGHKDAQIPGQGSRSSRPEQEQRQLSKHEEHEQFIAEQQRELGMLIGDPTLRKHTLLQLAQHCSSTSKTRALEIQMTKACVNDLRRLIFKKARVSSSILGVDDSLSKEHLGSQHKQAQQLGHKAKFGGKRIGKMSRLPKLLDDARSTSEEHFDLVNSSFLSSKVKRIHWGLSSLQALRSGSGITPELVSQAKAEAFLRHHLHQLVKEHCLGHLTSTKSGSFKRSVSSSILGMEHLRHTFDTGSRVANASVRRYSMFHKP
jgi:hypothetical protein